MTAVLATIAFAASSLGPAAAVPPAGIEGVDFRDGTVVFNKVSYRLKNGKLAAPDESDAILNVTIGKPAFGYVDGIPGEVAAVLVHSFDNDATGYFSEVNVFALRGGRPALVADLPGGDRARGGIRSAAFAGGRLVVEMYGGGVCCPTYVDTVRYRFADGKLVRDGHATRRSATQGKDY